jgi:DNA-binding CsgD family transcriptional regulator
MRLPPDSASELRISDDGATSGIASNRVRRPRLEGAGATPARLLSRGGLPVDPRLARDATEPGVEQLSPRLHQTLARLLEGDSEKQAAARLGLSPATVHEYVTALYRRFGVQSRAELLVLVLRRIPRPLEDRGDSAALQQDPPREAPPRLRLVRGGQPPRRRGTI